MRRDIFTNELKHALVAFNEKANEHATLQDFVMFILGNNIVELDYENPFYKGDKHE